MQAALEQQAAELRMQSEARVAAAVGVLSADAARLQQQADKQACQLAAEHAAAVAELQQAHGEALEKLRCQHTEAAEHAAAQHRQQLEQLQAEAQVAHTVHNAKLRCAGSAAGAACRVHVMHPYLSRLLAKIKCSVVCSNAATRSSPLSLFSLPPSIPLSLLSAVQAGVGSSSCSGRAACCSGPTAAGRAAQA